MPDEMRTTPPDAVENSYGPPTRSSIDNEFLSLLQRGAGLKRRITVEAVYRLPCFRNVNPHFVQDRLDRAIMRGDVTIETQYEGPPTVRINAPPIPEKRS